MDMVTRNDYSQCFKMMVVDLMYSCQGTEPLTLRDEAIGSDLVEFVVLGPSNDTCRGAS